MLRIEDLDLPRVVAGAQAGIEADLRWLGLDWDEAPLRQSERTAHYEAALACLAAKGLVYACDCSRSDIARVASAPHPGEETVYPGCCRERNPARPMRRPPALRARVPDGEVCFDDGVAGRISQNLAHEVGDFVLKRGDGVFAYQLAVVVDDLATGITHVVRGMDLLGSTPRQVWLARALGCEPPSYMHVPLVVAADGSRLEKRTRGVTVHELRKAGISAASVIGELAHGLGLQTTNVPRTPSEVARVSIDREVVWRRQPWSVPASLVGTGDATA